MTLKDLIVDGGRKYAVVITTLRYGFLLSLVGLAVAAVVPAIAIHVAGIVGAFGILGSVAVAAYQGAHAVQDWKHPTGVETPPASSHAHTPRQSGVVPEPGSGG